MDLANFTPETPTEFALHQEIRRLTSELHRAGAYPKPSYAFDPDPFTSPRELPPTITLRKDVFVEARYTPRGRGSVEVLGIGYTHSREALEYAYYVDPTQVYQAHHIADMMTHLHKEMIFKLGKFIMEK